MAYHTTILRQIIDIFPRHEFKSLARDYHVGQKFRSFNRWTQFMVMLIGQLSGRKSLRDLVMNMSAQTSKLYHLAIKPCSRATLARVNEKQPAASLLPSIGSSLTASSICLMPRLSISAFPFFPGPGFARPKVPLNYMSGLTVPAICLSLSRLPMVGNMRATGPRPRSCRLVPWSCSTWVLPTTAGTRAS